MKTSDSIVIIPTYNEKENIENIIRAVMALEDNFNMLIIDDGSPDGTASIVKGLMETDFKDRLLTCPACSAHAATRVMTWPSAHVT